MRALRLGAAALAIAASIPTGAAEADGYRPITADRYRPAPQFMEPITYDWSGFYLGGQLGGAYGSVDWNYNGTPISVEETTTSFAGGAHAGAQKQWGRMVLGIDVAYTWADLQRTAPAPLLTNSTLTASANDILLVTGKVGYAFDNLLASVRAGWASATVDFTTNLNGTVATSSSERESGWTAALGIEYAVLPNVILGVEYDYIRINAAGTGNAGVIGTISDGGVDIQTVLARLSFKFGSRTEPIPVVAK
jgi:outer membrane immunogenic protein